MTLGELKGKYLRLSDEIDTLVAAGDRNAGRQARLLHELDQVHREIAARRRGVLAVPTLHDVVGRAADAAPARAAG
jgi:hypothetical protein